jgi:hypothetical protein
MQIQVSFSAKSLKEAGRMMRPWYYWPRVILRTGYFYLFLGILIWGFFYSLISSKGNLQTGLLCGSVAFLMILLLAWRYRRGVRTLQKYLNEANPVSLSLDNGGLSIAEKSGKSTFTPWSTISSFREGRYIFLLHLRESKDVRIIPKEGLSSPDTERVRLLLAGTLAG